jgi:hypothetical protein
MDIEANEIGLNEIGANEIGANEIGANEIGANEIGANEIGANEIIGGEKNPVKKLAKYPKVKTIGLFTLEMTKEIYLDNYYSKDFLKKYFS